MKTFKLKVLAGALLGASIGVPSTASAAGYPVFDAVVAAAVESVAGAVAAMSASVSTLLYNIGSAINQNGQKVSSTIEAAAQTQRDFNVLQESNRRMEDARQRYDVPTSRIGIWRRHSNSRLCGFRKSGDSPWRRRRDQQSISRASRQYAGSDPKCRCLACSENSRAILRHRRLRCIWRRSLLPRSVEQHAWRGQAHRLYLGGRRHRWEGARADFFTTTDRRSAHVCAKLGSPLSGAATSQSRG